MDTIQQVITCAFGPRIYRIFKNATAAVSIPVCLPHARPVTHCLPDFLLPVSWFLVSRVHIHTYSFTHFNHNTRQGKEYPANGLEKVGDTTMQLLSICCSVGLYTSPIVLTYLYHRTGSLTPQSVSLMAATAVVLFSSGLVIRAYGRFLNPEYQSFLLKRNTADYKHYDWDFSHWPVDFQWSDGPADSPLPQVLSQMQNRRTASGLESISSLPCKWLTFLAVHTFGRRMMYPGSVALLQQAMHPMLSEGRQRLVERFSGQRFKLKTADENEIDVMLIDRRSSSTAGSKGKKLVICCEGNAGFYEVGIMCTPIDSGYSVLGWNHPGFGGSTGLPFPGQEVHAMDTVIRFAKHKLGFKEEDILLFAWSIGGFPGSWAGSQYPNVSGMILDATFDDILPLAVSKMPATWKPLVVNTIRSYFDLNISDNLSRYKGPVLLIRRLKDEIIHTVETEPIRTNRANHLLTKLLTRRFPHLMREEDVHWTLLDYLSGDRSHQARVMAQHMVKEMEARDTLVKYVQDNGMTTYPLMIGESGMQEEEKTRLVLFLAAKHLVDYDSTHCSPLPRNLFQEPWDLFREAGVSGGPGTEDEEKDKNQGKL